MPIKPDFALGDSEVAFAKSRGWSAQRIHDQTHVLPASLPLRRGRKPRPGQPRRPPIAADMAAAAPVAADTAAAGFSLADRPVWAWPLGLDPWNDRLPLRLPRVWPPSRCRVPGTSAFPLLAALLVVVQHFGVAVQLMKSKAVNLSLSKYDVRSLLSPLSASFDHLVGAGE
jgi:hypothetical protein